MGIRTLYHRVARKSRVLTGFFRPRGSAREQAVRRGPCVGVVEAGGPCMGAIQSGGRCASGRGRCDVRIKRLSRGPGSRVPWPQRKVHASIIPFPGPHAQSLRPRGEQLRPSRKQLCPRGKELRPLQEQLRPRLNKLRPSREQSRPLEAFARPSRKTLDPIERNPTPSRQPPSPPDEPHNSLRQGPITPHQEDRPGADSTQPQGFSPREAGPLTPPPTGPRSRPRGSCAGRRGGAPRPRGCAPPRRTVSRWNSHPPLAHPPCFGNLLSSADPSPPA